MATRSSVTPPPSLTLATPCRCRTIIILVTLIIIRRTAVTAAVAGIRHRSLSLISVSRASVFPLSLRLSDLFRRSTTTRRWWWWWSVVLQHVTGGGVDGGCVVVVGVRLDLGPDVIER
ncbi:hypothetical protein Hanom_Chr04g00316701 [Helianthus anomalus]